MAKLLTFLLHLKFQLKNESKVMIFKSPFLNQVNHVSEVPPQSYIFYSLEKGIFWIKAKNYPQFVLQWMGSSDKPALTMDLSSAIVHSIILDFDYITSLSFTAKLVTNMIETIQCILKSVLLPNVKNFTFIVALRKDGRGVHIHLPEFKIGSDDYVLFCESLQYKFKEVMMGEEKYKLDIIANAMLPGAAKPNKRPYVPFKLVYVEEEKEFSLVVFNPNDTACQQNIRSLKKLFPKRKDNEKSIFREILNCTPHLMIVKLAQYMMPIISEIETHTLAYETVIGKILNDTPEFNDVAYFVHKKSNERGFIRKSKILSINKTKLFRVYQYLQYNARMITNFETNNYVINTWYKRISQNEAASRPISHIPQLF